MKRHKRSPEGCDNKDSRSSSAYINQVVNEKVLCSYDDLLYSASAAAARGGPAERPQSSSPITRAESTHNNDAPLALRGSINYMHVTRLGGVRSNTGRVVLLRFFSTARSLRSEGLRP